MTGEASQGDGDAALRRQTLADLAGGLRELRERRQEEAGPSRRQAPTAADRRNAENAAWGFGRGSRRARPNSHNALRANGTRSWLNHWYWPGDAGDRPRRSVRPELGSRPPAVAAHDARPGKPEACGFASLVACTAAQPLDTAREPPPPARLPAVLHRPHRFRPRQRDDAGGARLRGAPDDRRPGPRKRHGPRRRHGFRSRTRSTRWSAPFRSTSRARPRVGRMLSIRFRSLIDDQISCASPRAASSPRAAKRWK
jgi:hypothetical protein